jgi:hypothetical protein
MASNTLAILGLDEFAILDEDYGNRHIIRAYIAIAILIAVVFLYLIFG